MVVEPRGKEKVLENPLRKSKKTRLVKALEGEPEKTELLASDMLAVEVVAVRLRFHPGVLVFIQLSPGMCLTLPFFSHADSGGEFAYSFLAVPRLSATHARLEGGF